MKKVRAAVVGYGNIGRYVLEALQAASDFEIAGVVRRSGADDCPAELREYPVVKTVKELRNVDVAILCTPTRKVEEYAKEFLALCGYSGFAPHARCGGQGTRYGGCHIGRLGSGKRFHCSYLA